MAPGEGLALMGAYRAHVSRLISEIAGVPLAEGWSYDNPIAGLNGRCVCGERGDEIARGVLHPQCIRRVASMIVAAKIDYATRVHVGEIVPVKPRTRGA